MRWKPSQFQKYQLTFADISGTDTTALVAYRFAIAAMMSGRFSLSEASGGFILVALGGTGIRLAVGWLVARFQRRLDDPPVQITISLLTPFAAYIPAGNATQCGRNWRKRQQLTEPPETLALRIPS
jgi:hypothetical protein